jgi:hypothetical protein
MSSVTIEIVLEALCTLAIRRIRVCARFNGFSLSVPGFEYVEVILPVLICWQRFEVVGGSQPCSQGGGECE